MHDLFSHWDEVYLHKGLWLAEELESGRYLAEGLQDMASMGIMVGS